MKILDYMETESEHEAMNLYIAALKKKILPIFGSTERALRVLLHNHLPAHCLTALFNNKLVGILGIQTKKGGFLKPTLGSMAYEYGLIGGFYRYIGLTLLHNVTKENEWYIDGIAVEKKMRSNGIGTKLLEYLETSAKKKGLKNSPLML